MKICWCIPRKSVQIYPSSWSLVMKMFSFFTWGLQNYLPLIHFHNFFLLSGVSCISMILSFFVWVSNFLFPWKAYKPVQQKLQKVTYVASLPHTNQICLFKLSPLVSVASVTWIQNKPCAKWSLLSFTSYTSSLIYIWLIHSFFIFYKRWFVIPIRHYWVSAIYVNWDISGKWDKMNCTVYPNETS